MFRKVISVFTKGTAIEKAGFSSYIHHNLDEDLYKLYIDYVDGKINKGSANYTRASAIEAIAKVMPNVREFFKEPAREVVFWKTHVLPYLKFALYDGVPGEEAAALIKKSGFLCLFGLHYTIRTKRCRPS